MLQLGVTSLLTSIVIGALVIYLVQYIWRRRWLYYYGSKIEGPFAFPFIGCAYLFLGGQDVYFDKMMKIFEQYQSSVFRVWLGNVLGVVIPNPDDIETVLNKHLEKPSLYNFLNPFLGKSITTAPVEIWKPHRKIVNLTVNYQILKSFMDTFVEQANDLVHKLDQRVEKDYVDLWPYMFETSLNSICETSLGSKVKGMDGTNQYIHWITKIESLLVSRVVKFWLHFEFLWQLSALSKEFEGVCRQIRVYVGKIVESKRLEKSTNPHDTVAEQESFSNETTILPRKKIFLDLLLDITDVQEKWKNEELMDEANTMVLTGSETTAVMASTAMVLLAMYQEKQNKVYQEMFDIFGNSNRSCTTDDLSRMRYLEQVIKETMRLFPIFPLLPRAMDTNVTLGNKTIVPKGSIAVIPVILIHRSAQHWKDPLKFHPERFSPEEVAKRHKYTYMPFSLGPRDCVGKAYAMMSMKIFLSTILRNFRMVSTPYKSVEDIKLLTNVVLKAKNGYKVQMERRENTVAVT